VLSLGAIYFTLQAGEFSTREILLKRSYRRRLLSQVDSLQRQVDSLTRVERTIRADPAMQERIAREDFGMVRGDNEIIYKFVAPSASDPAASTKGQPGAP
jgi:cell division protein FtsB